MQVWVFENIEANEGGELIDIYKTKELGEPDFMEEYEAAARMHAGTRHQRSVITHHEDGSMSFTVGISSYHLYPKDVVTRKKKVAK